MRKSWRSLAFALVTAAVVPATGIVPAWAASPAAMSSVDRDLLLLIKSDDADDAKMSDADKRAKAIECSKQADEKKLHGEARKKFRTACKRGK